MPTYERPSKGHGGVYVIWLSDQHYYGGSTKSFRWRWYEHLRTLKNGTHKNPHMQAVFNQHRHFEPSIIEVITDRDPRIEAEQGWLDTHFGKVGCVNICAQAIAAPMEGRTHSAESRRKMSDAKRGKRLPKAHRQALSEAQKRRHAKDGGHSEETRKRISESLQGTQRPDVADRNRASAGWKHTEEALTKISAAGRTGAFKGKSHSEETRQKISAALKGRSPSEETLRKRSESLKRAWARRKAAKAAK